MLRTPSFGCTIKINNQNTLLGNLLGTPFCLMIWWPTEVHTEHQNHEERLFKCLLIMACLFVPDRLVWAFHNMLICWDFHTWLSLGITANGLKKRKHPMSGSSWSVKCLVDARVQRRMARLLRAATLTQITRQLCFSQSMQKSIPSAQTAKHL